MNSIYDTPNGDEMLTAAPVQRRRGTFKLVGVIGALAMVAVGAATYMAVGHAAATPNMDCTLIVPANPLSAAGLATPYQLVATNPNNGPCNEANANQSAYVQGAILTADGQLTLYNPLVIDQGTQPAAPTAAAQVPAGSTVALWFGFNGNNLTLQSAAAANSLQQGNCVNGLPGSIFGQFAYCNAPAFFQMANSEIAANKLQVPALGTAKDGLPCPTVRDFSVVDQDQSDNVTTHYLATANGLTAQPNAAARAKLQNQQLTDLANGSDNRLLDVFVDPTLGCTPWMRPDTSNDGQPAPSLPLNELQAAAHQQAPVAVVPMTDPMALANGTASTNKTNTYRAGVDQPAVGAANNGDGATYCKNLFTSPMGIQRVFKDMAIFAGGPSPDAGAATNLFTFLAMRANQTFTNLNCGNLLNMANPIALTMDGNGVVTAATFTAGGATSAGTVATPSASASASAATGITMTTTGAPAPTPSATRHHRRRGANATNPVASPTP